jgi:hypothetical protein
VIQGRDESDSAVVLLAGATLERPGRGWMQLQCLALFSLLRVRESLTINSASALQFAPVIALESELKAPACNPEQLRENWDVFLQWRKVDSTQASRGSAPVAPVLQSLQSAAAGLFVAHAEQRSFNG